MAKKPQKTRYTSPPTPVPTEPPDAPNGWWLYMSPQWHAHVQGLIKWLEQRDLWEGTESEVDDCIGWVQDLELGSIPDSQMVLDVRINDGRLEKLVGGMWVDVGAIDAFTVSAHTLPAGSAATADFDANNIDFGIPQGLQGAQGIQGIQGIPGIDGEDGVTSGSYEEFAAKAVPAPTDPDAADKYCFAAHSLAKEYLDAGTDLLEVLRLSVDQGSAQIQWGLAALIGWIPWVGDVSDETLELATTLLSTSLTFAISQMGDDDAIALAAEQIFCALQQSYPNFDNMYDYIDYPSLMPSISIVPSLTEGVLALWENFDNVVDFAIDTFLTGEEWGWLIIAFGETLQRAAEIPILGGIQEGLGYPGELAKVVPQIMANAEYFDDRDCSGFEDCFPPETWCVHLDLTVSDYGFLPVEGNAVYEAGNGFRYGDPDNADRVFIKLAFGANLTVTRMAFNMSANTCPDTAVWICPNSDTISCGYIEVGYAGLEPEINGNYIANRVALGAECGASTDSWGYITGFTIEGEGVNPWDGQGVDCPPA